MLILYVACSDGLPGYAENKTPNATGVSRGFNVSWTVFGRLLEALADEKYTSERRKSEELIVHSQGIHVPRGQQMWDIERMAAIREQALGHAKEYLSEPELLAKKTIMMLAKINQWAATANSVKYSNLGPNVVEWFQNEITRWANALELLDDDGEALGFTAVDFLEDIDDDERTNIDFSGALDVEGARCVMAQIALVSRLRSFYTGNGRELLPRRLENAVSQIKDNWEAQPEFWLVNNDSTVKHDRLLLERLVRRGFAHILDDTGSCGLSPLPAAAISFKQIGLSKGALQTRANQLARELHNVVTGENGVNGGTGKVADKTNGSGKTGTQAGLASFWNQTPKAAPTNLPEPEVLEIDGSDPDSDIEIISPSYKRKDEGKDESSGSEEKKLRTS
jgi:hypothetical protein